MAKIRITNLERRMQVFQLTHACANSDFRAHSEKATRIQYDKDGNGHPITKRLRHGPVLRLPAKSTSEPLPAKVLREATIKNALKTRPPRIKFEYIQEAQAQELSTDEPETDMSRKPRRKRL